MSFGCRGGERRLARATNARAPGAGTKNRAMRSGDASFARAEDSYTSILTMHRAQVRWWGAGGGIAVGQTCASGRNQHRGHRKRTECDSPRVIAPAREAAWHVEKRKEVEASVPARTRELGFGCLHVACTLQKSVGGVWSRIRSANALQKERSGSSERGPSSEHGSAGDTVGRCVGRNASSRVGLTAKSGRGSAQDPG